MSSQPHPAAELSITDRAAFQAEVVPRYRPIVLKGAVRDWPAVQAGLRSPQHACDYLTGFDRGAAAEAFIGSPDIKGRYFYRPDLAGFNFVRRKGPFAEILRHILQVGGTDDAPAIYIGSVPTLEVLPGFAEENVLALVDPSTVPRIWIGNQSVVGPHYDVSDNIACVVAGRRRFTLFPPEQVANLYIGPLDVTMAGQPASMVDLRDPDFERFPRFREALAAAQVAELEPGDAIYIPELWWHNVEALDPFNVLVNYWWRDVPPGAGSPFECLAHGILTIGELRPPLREAWKAMFDHYVFRANGDPAAHIPPEHRGILAPQTPALRARFKQFLLNMISRY